MEKKELSANDSRFAAEIGNLIPALNRFARLLYRDRESAADLTQETLAKAWKARGSFASGTNLKAWLFAIMRNQFHSEARRSWRQVPWDQRAAEAIPAAPGEQLWSVELDHTARAVNALPVLQRDALILAGFGGFSSKDTATVLGCRITAVKSRVCRARQAVQAALEGTRQITTVGQQHGAAPIARMAEQMHRLRSRSQDTRAVPP
jgi:RNA polymerase sigma-70 factor (ECF subfamily)